jgi:hypothetical protein
METIPDTFCLSGQVDYNGGDAETVAGQVAGPPFEPDLAQVDQQPAEHGGVGSELELGDGGPGQAVAGQVAQQGQPLGKVQPETGNPPGPTAPPKPGFLERLQQAWEEMLFQLSSWQKDP